MYGPPRQPAVVSRVGFPSLLSAEATCVTKAVDFVIFIARVIPLSSAVTQQGRNSHFYFSQSALGTFTYGNRRAYLLIKGIEVCQFLPAITHQGRLVFTRFKLSI